MNFSIVRKYLLAYFGLLFLVGGVGGTLWLVTNQASMDTRTKAAGASVLLTLGGANSATVNSSYPVTVSIGNADAYPISATAVTVNWTPANALRLDSVTPEDFFMQSAITTPTEMLKLGVTCATNTDCRPEISDPSNISTAIQCVADNNGKKFCQNISNTTVKVPPLNQAGTHTFYLGARCPTAVPPTTNCLTNIGGGPLATLSFTPLLPGTAVTISLDSNTDKTAVAATTQTTNLVSSSSFTTPLGVSIAGSSTGQADMAFKIKFERITGIKTRLSSISYKIMSGATQVASGTTSLSGDSTGTYTGVIGGVTPGNNYDIYLKESTHLQKKFSNVTLVSGANAPFDWTGSVMAGGDASRDNLVDLSDFVILAQDFSGPNQATSLADFTYDTLVDLSDFVILAGNYDKRGD